MFFSMVYFEFYIYWGKKKSVLEKKIEESIDRIRKNIFFPVGSCIKFSEVVR